MRIQLHGAACSGPEDCMTVRCGPIEGHMNIGGGAGSSIVICAGLVTAMDLTSSGTLVGMGAAWLAFDPCVSRHMYPHPTQELFSKQV